MSHSARISPHAIRLRPTEPRDVPVMFEHQLDPEGNRLAGTKPRDRETFMARWEKIIIDPNVTPRMILDGDTIVGTISRFQVEGVDHIGYWIDRPHWGKGYASAALRLFLRECTIRPLHASIARANAASARILEKCGFRVTGYEMGEESDRYVGCELVKYVLE